MIYIILIEILFNIFHRRITQKHCSVSFLKDKFLIIYLLLGVNKFSNGEGKFFNKCILYL